MERCVVEGKQRKALWLAEPAVIVICKHCGKEIDEVMLIGLSLLCPLCGRPQNGQPIDPVKDDEVKIICKHCGKSIDQSELRGLSLICPHCSRPQDGQQ